MSDAASNKSNQWCDEGGSSSSSSSPIRPLAASAEEGEEQGHHAPTTRRQPSSSTNQNNTVLDEDDDPRASLRQVQLTQLPQSLAELEAAFLDAQAASSNKKDTITNSKANGNNYQRPEYHEMDFDEQDHIDEQENEREPQETILWCPSQRAFISNLTQFGIVPPHNLSPPPSTNLETDDTEEGDYSAAAMSVATIIVDASDESMERYWDWTIHAATAQLERNLWIEILTGRNGEHYRSCRPPQQYRQSSSLASLSPTMKIKLGSTLPGYASIPFSDADWEHIVRTNPTLGYDSLTLTPRQGVILARTALRIQLDDCQFEDPTSFYGALQERQRRHLRPRCTSNNHDNKLQGIGMTGRLVSSLWEQSQDQLLEEDTTRLWDWFKSCHDRGNSNGGRDNDTNDDVVVLSSLSLERFAIPTCRHAVFLRGPSFNQQYFFPRFDKLSLSHCRVDLDVVAGLVRRGLQILHMQGLVPRTTNNTEEIMDDDEEEEDEDDRAEDSSFVGISRRGYQHIQQQQQFQHRSNNNNPRAAALRRPNNASQWESLVEAIVQNPSLQHWTLWEMASGSPYVVEVIQRQANKSTSIPSVLHTLDLDDIFDFTPSEWQDLLAAVDQHSSLRFVRVRSVLDGVRYKDIPDSFWEDYLQPVRRLLETNRRVNVSIPSKRYTTRFGRSCPLAPLRRLNEWRSQVERLSTAMGSPDVCAAKSMANENLRSTTGNTNDGTTRKSLLRSSKRSASTDDNNSEKPRRYLALVSRSFHDKNKTRLRMLLRQHLDVLVLFLQKRQHQTTNHEDNEHDAKRLRRE